MKGKPMPCKHKIIKLSSNYCTRCEKAQDGSGNVFYRSCIRVYWCPVCFHFEIRATINGNTEYEYIHPEFLPDKVRHSLFISLLDAEGESTAKEPFTEDELNKTLQDLGNAFSNFKTENDRRYKKRKGLSKGEKTIPFFPTGARFQSLPLD